ncbi:DNA gyrase inhibitor YacG [Haliangium ochraceum]|nr:DNA gyrase inhibitor YacG [Haliangium ochraceum]
MSKSSKNKSVSKSATPCIVCNEPALPRPDNAAHPFCSPRCQMVDLGRWLDGDYCIPGEPLEDISSEPEGGSGGGFGFPH